MHLPKDIIEKLEAMGKTGKIQFPPPIAQLVKSSFVVYEEDHHMTMRFEIEEGRTIQHVSLFGGIYGLFFDMIMGLFSGLETGGITSSLDLNITFIKSATPADEYVEVITSIINQSRSFIILSAEAINKDDKLVATATSRMMMMMGPSRIPKS